jgi:hypothetical protein
VTIHVCASDGQPIGEFAEQDFRERSFAGQFPPDSYYWHEGMEDWGPIADYRALAKTQRISFAPPRARTVRINMDKTDGTAPSVAKPESSLSRLWRRLTGKHD